MTIEITVDRHCIKHPEDKVMLSARAYLHTLRRQIRAHIGFAQSTLPTILDFHRRSTKERQRYLSKNWGGYLKKVRWLDEPKEGKNAEYMTNNGAENTNNPRKEGSMA